MTAQIPADQPHHAQPVSPVSRRSMLRGAAGAGAVGLAAAAGAGAVIASAKPASAAVPPAGNAATLDNASPHVSDEPLVVYLRDTASGEFEVFNGTRQVTIRNPRLAAELLSGLKTA